MADFEAMTTFVAVVKSGGFRGAAAVMRIRRSTVSHRIGRLEQDLGVRLLERTTRKLSRPRSASSSRRCRSRASPSRR
jgi:DNA-binding transcriptional LysR family regulator